MNIEFTICKKKRTINKIVFNLPLNNYEVNFFEIIIVFFLFRKLYLRNMLFDISQKIKISFKFKLIIVKWLPIVLYYTMYRYESN